MSDDLHESEFQGDLKIVDYLAERCDVPLGQAMLSTRSVVLLLGATSSGKTSLVNEFLGIELKRTSAGSADNQFSIIEVIDERDFNALCSKRFDHASSSSATAASASSSSSSAHSSENELTIDELREPKPSVQNPRSIEWMHRRLHRLFLPLGSLECIHRYGTALKILTEDRLRESEPFGALLVNARYVKNPDAKKLLVIDSEGLDLNSRDLARDFPVRLNLLDRFFRLSDHVVFLLRAGSLTEAIPSLQCLNILLGYSSLPPRQQAQYIDKLMPLLSIGAQKVIRAAVPGGAILAPALDLLFRFSNSDSSAAERDSEDAVSKSQSAKVAFVISQMDLCVDVADERAQIFTLGTLLGRHLPKVHRLQTESLFPISIPATHRRQYEGNALPFLLATVFRPTHIAKRISREVELRSRLRQCTFNSPLLEIEFFFRRSLCGFPSMQELLARSHRRQAFFSSHEDSPPVLRARL